jgi:hypothetical protein
MNEFGDYLQLNKKSNLIIGVNPNNEKILKFADWAKTEYSLTAISLNKEISKVLIGKPTAKFSRIIIDWLTAKSEVMNENPVLITEINILFEPSFELDPLTLFKMVSRNNSLIVMWPGEYKNNFLIYAIPEHAHYRTWINPGVEIYQI